MFSLSFYWWEALALYLCLDGPFIDSGYSAVTGHTSSQEIGCLLKREYNGIDGISRF